MRLSTVKLTDSYVAKLKPGVKPGAPEGAKPIKYCVWDSMCPGFGVEVTPAGGKLLVIKTCRDGVRGWHTLGRWPLINVESARTKAYSLKDQVRQGEDPKAAIEAKKAEASARKQAMTVSQLADRFIKEHIQASVTQENGRLKVVTFGLKTGNKPSTAKEHVRLIEKHIRPALGHLAVKDVGTAEISEMLFKIRKDTPILANRVRSVLGKMFSRAELWGLRTAGSNPIPSQDRVKEKKRERNLTGEEITDLGQAIRNAESPEDGSDPESPYALAAIRLALLTGMRRGELLGMRWEWLNPEDGVIILPVEEHKTGRKTGKVRIVHLCAAAKEVLAKLENKLGNPYIISGHVHGQALVNIQDPWDRLRRAAGLDFKEAWLKANNQTWDQLSEAQQEAIEAKQPHFHDLRRTFASVATNLGYPELWIGALLGHSAGTVTAGYARVGQDPLMDAVENIGAHIDRLLKGLATNLRAESHEASSSRIS